MIDAKGRVVVSNSTLRDVATCTTADVARHAMGVTGEDVTGPRSYGTSWHLAMQAHLQGKDAMAEFEDAYRAWAEEHAASEDFKRDCTWEAAKLVMEEWLRAHPISALPYQVNPELVEVSFQLPLGPFYIRGRMDAVVEDDGLWVLDFKTTGRLDSNFWRQYRMDSALTGYVWAAEQTLGESIRGVIVEGVERRAVSTATKKCPTHGVAYAECNPLHVKWGMERFPRDASEVKAWHETALRLAEAHERNMLLQSAAETPQEGKFHGACYKYEGFAACDFAKYCEAGRPREFSPELFGLEKVKEH